MNPSGIIGWPATSAASGSETSTAAPAARSRSARYAWSAASSRGGAPRDVRRRVEADERLEELDELVLARGDRVADALFEGGELLDLQTELHLAGERGHNATVNPGTAALVRGLAVLGALADGPGRRATGSASSR